MLNSEKKICALRDKKMNILTLVLSEKKKHTPPPFKLNGRPLKINRLCCNQVTDIFDGVLILETSKVKQ